MDALKGKPEGVNALRWFNHISALKQKGHTFPGEKKSLESYGDKVSVPAPSAPKKEAEDEDDIDLFGSDDDVDEEAEKVKQARIAEYAAKKSAKPAVIAKSNVILDIKPWDDETDMAELEAVVRKIEMDGLVMGKGQLVAVGYGIKKLVLSCVVEDAKVGVDDLIELICADEGMSSPPDLRIFVSNVHWFSNHHFRMHMLTSQTTFSQSM